MMVPTTSAVAEKRAVGMHGKVRFGTGAWRVHTAVQVLASLPSNPGVVLNASKEY